MVVLICKDNQEIKLYEKFDVTKIKMNGSTYDFIKDMEKHMIKINHFKRILLHIIEFYNLLGYWKIILYASQELNKGSNKSDMISESLKDALNHNMYILLIIIRSNKIYI